MPTGLFPVKVRNFKFYLYLQKRRQQNYYPISILPSISKIFEKAMYNRLVAHLESSHLFGDQQHGFRINKSIVKASVNFSDGIYYVYCLKTNEYKPVNNVP